jgi:hypothetical protein
VTSGNCNDIGDGDGNGVGRSSSSGTGVATAVGVGELTNKPTVGTAVPSVGAGAGFRNRNAPPETSKITINRMKPHSTNSAGGMFFMRRLNAFIRLLKF